MMNEFRAKVTRHGRRKYLVMYYDDPVTGKREQRSTKKTNRRDAERAAAKWEAELQAGKYHRDSRMTWEQFRERYEDEKLAADSVHMQKATGTAFNHFERLIAPKYLRSVTTALVSQFQTKLREEGHKAESITTHLRHLRTALNWAAEQKLLGEKAGVVVNKAEGKFASAHDLRRAFGTRWATKVKPPVLQRLMRHRDISTTLTYYVALDADDIADELWEKHPGVGTSVGTLPNPPSQDSADDTSVNEKTRCGATG